MNIKRKDNLIFNAKIIRTKPDWWYNNYIGSIVKIVTDIDGELFVVNDGRFKETIFYVVRDIQCYGQIHLENIERIDRKKKLNRLLED